MHKGILASFVYLISAVNSAEVTVCRATDLGGPSGYDGFITFD